MDQDQASLGTAGWDYSIFLFHWLFLSSPPPPRPPFQTSIWSFLRRSVRLMTVPVFLSHLWAASDFSLLLLSVTSVSVSRITFPNLCVAAVPSTHLSPQNSSSKSAPLSFVKLFFHCCYRSHNIHRLHTQGENWTLLHLLKCYCWSPPSSLLFFMPLYYQMVILCRFLVCAISYLFDLFFRHRMFSAVILLLFLFLLQLELRSFPGASLPFLSASPTLLLSSSLNLASPSNLSCFPSPLLVQFTVQRTGSLFLVWRLFVVWT